MSKLDRQVQQEINTWDVTRCKRCGEEISMLYADSLKDGSGFVHRNGWCCKVPKEGYMLSWKKKEFIK